jgi:hypothetical protein
VNIGPQKRILRDTGFDQMRSQLLELPHDRKIFHAYRAGRGDPPAIKNFGRCEALHTPSDGHGRSSWQFNTAAFALMDPFADPHLNLALYSVGNALAVTALLLAGVIADHYNEHERHVRYRKEWWRK